MSGKNLRLERLLKRRKRLIISALDHVMEYGHQPGIEDAEKAIQNCMGVDALLLPQFMLRRNWHLFAEALAPVPVVRINWTSAFYYPLNYRQGCTTIATSVEDSVYSGAEVVICSLFLENSDEQMETANVGLFSEVVRQTDRLGIPLIGECYVVEHKEIGAKETHNKTKRVVRVMAELGADLIKCFFTGDRFAEIVENTPVPIFTIGADKLNTDLDVLMKAKNSVDHGARGIIFGRNIFMAKNPPLLIQALDDVMNNGTEPPEAAAKHQLA